MQSFLLMDNILLPGIQDSNKSHITNDGGSGIGKGVISYFFVVRLNWTHINKGLEMMGNYEKHLIFYLVWVI